MHISQLEPGATKHGLIVRDDTRMAASITAEAKRLKLEALTQAGQIQHVNNPEEQQEAVNAQASLARILTDAEKARVATKEPILTFGRLIDATAKAFVEELKGEQVRIAGLVGSFQQLEEARIRAAERLRQGQIEGLELDRQRALAEATSHDELDRINQEHNEAVAALPVEMAAKADGQKVGHQWSITVADIWLLARAHPGCVKIEPRLAEIKSLLDAGVKVAGVVAKREIKASVTTRAERPAIEV